MKVGNDLSRFSRISRCFAFRAFLARLAFLAVFFPRFYFSRASCILRGFAFRAFLARLAFLAALPFALFSHFARSLFPRLTIFHALSPL